MTRRRPRTAGFLHPGHTRRRAATVNQPAEPSGQTKLDRGEHRHIIQGGGTPPRYKINNRLHRELDSLVALTDDIPDLDHSTIGRVLKRGRFVLI